MNDKVSIRIEQAHDCGQVFVQTTHIILDEAFRFVLSSELPPLTEPASAMFKLSMEAHRNIELSGHYGEVEWDGMEWRRGEGLVCSKCGKNVLFPKDSV